MTAPVHRCSICRRYATAGVPHNCTPPQPVELRPGAPVLEYVTHEGSERAA